MKSLQKKLKRTTSTALGFAISSLLLPSLALAQVKITEIMYDAPGADTGREWVEVANLGSQNVDIGKYKLLESGTNHGLKLVQGASVLAPNGVAIIAADPTKFLADYPAFSGALFDSAFSLSNTEESLTLKDASSSVLDTASYASVAEANGTGGSLNVKDGSFVAAMASPGVYPGPMTPVPKPEPTPGKTSTKTTVKKSTATSPSKTFPKKGSATSPFGGSAASNTFSDSNTASLSLAPALSQPVLIGLGLGATMLLGIAGIFFLRLGKKETLNGAEEFEIVE
jgi:hypothetical protein